MESKSGRLKQKSNKKSLGQNGAASKHQVTEPAAAYASRKVSAAATPVLRWLGAVGIMAQANATEFDYLNIGREGLPKSAVDTLSEHLGISRKTMAEDILDLSVRTLERKGADEKLDSRTSAHALELARVMEHAYAVFEDEAAVQRWLAHENRALAGHKPLQLMGTLTGLNMVHDVLTRIEEGVYS